MSALASALPFVHWGELPIGIPIQSFGLIVAIGVLIGAAILRRYAEWHGIDDELIRGLLGWVTVCGFIGAHEFDMIFYNWDKIGDSTIVPPAHWWPGFLPTGLYPSNWPLPLKLWEGISSYGGFIGGAIGWAIFVWWKRQPFRLFADITIVGLLPAFSIGRIGCTVVSDHIGAAVDPSKWYAFLAMDYPRKLNLGHLAEHYPNLTGETIKAWNLGLIEFLYLVPVNILILWLAFRPSRRLNAGTLVGLAGLLYAPIRFFLDFLRPEDSDPRHFGLTFAQWASFLAFGAAAYVIFNIMKNGKPAVPVTTTSGEAQRRLKMLLKEEEEKAAEEEVRAKDAAKKTVSKSPAAPAKEESKAAAKPAAKTDEEKEEELLAKEALAAGKTEDAEKAVAAAATAKKDEPADEGDDEEDEEPAATAAPAKPSGPKPGQGRPGGGGKKKKKKIRR